MAFFQVSIISLAMLYKYYKINGLQLGARIVDSRIDENNNSPHTRSSEISMCYSGLTHETWPVFDGIFGDIFDSGADPCWISFSRAGWIFVIDRNREKSRLYKYYSRSSSKLDIHSESKIW